MTVYLSTAHHVHVTRHGRASSLPVQPNNCSQTLEPCWSEVTFYLIIIPPASPTNLAQEHKHFPHHGVVISGDKTEISNLNIVREGSGRNTDRLTEPRQTRNCLIFLIADNQCNTMPGQWLVTISPSRYSP